MIIRTKVTFTKIAPNAYIALFSMKRFLSIVFLLLSVTAYSQLDNRAFEQRMAIQPADSNKLFLGINLMGFGKNNEYFDTTVEGYTLFGYQLNPYLSYHINKNVRFDVGVYAQKDFGNDAYTEVLPTFSLKIRQNNFSFIFGTLEGNLNHRLIEPLYDFERVLNNRLENGIQMLWLKDDLFLDVWVDWQKMIYQNSAEQERFTAGISFNKTLFRSGNFHIDLPLQIVASHQGGQINVGGSEVITRYNGAAGLTFESDLTGFVNSIGLKSYVTGSRTDANTPVFESGRGSGIFINPYLKTKIGLTVMGSYWRGDRFLTIQGNQLYPSVSENYPGRLDEIRDFFMLRLLYDVKVAEGLTLTGRAEPFYDTYAEALEYSFGVYLNFSERFFLLNAKKNQ
jgi:hypothetical protein